MASVFLYIAKGAILTILSMFHGMINTNMSVMGEESGFTVVEVVTTLAIMGLLLTFMFQTFFVGQSQQLTTARFAAANDLAQTNLRKITNKTQIKSGIVDSNNIDNANCNSLNDVTGVSTYTPSPAPATNPIGAPDHSTRLHLDNGADVDSVSSPLPLDTNQYLYVRYPQGCDIAMPAQIISVVTYGSETITRTSYVTAAL